MVSLLLLVVFQWLPDMTSWHRCSRMISVSGKEAHDPALGTITLQNPNGVHAYWSLWRSFFMIEETKAKSVTVELFMVAYVKEYEL